MGSSEYFANITGRTDEDTQRHQGKEKSLAPLMDHLGYEGQKRQEFMDYVDNIVDRGVRYLAQRFQAAGIYLDQYMDISFDFAWIASEDGGFPKPMLTEGGISSLMPMDGIISIIPEAERVDRTVDDDAATAPDRKGGIDFNPALLDLQIKRDEHGIPLPIDPAMIDNININGLTPVIIQLTPITNLPLILGFADSDEIEPIAKADKPRNRLPKEERDLPQLSMVAVREQYN